ncbi:hypothetical protein P2H44_04000 [Albimonas sp. CAU 1670]|uniref:hypothetical protein n=1 Tax=Albimonas sp. CAU 1670 TaxID=3032599 RepID=UPI0023DB4AD4|nr:hypothetical protein [Albimonas sp. CAU 1670]MDF2231708.1 hypothetical protein [Albimonas sp. CAU 1670]
MSDAGSFAVTRFNAIRHGVLTRDALLPWEDPSEFEALLQALVEEHRPSGPTEEHLTEEIAGVIWRKRRLRMAERAAHQRGLQEGAKTWKDLSGAATTHRRASVHKEPTGPALEADPSLDAADLGALEAFAASVHKGCAAMSGPGEAALEAFLDDLPPILQDLAADFLRATGVNPEEDDLADLADGDELGACFIERIEDFVARRRLAIEARPLIRMQAIGESLDADRLDKLARYESHLDRKLERMLSMLLRLKERRSGGGER